jgi:hypothetical protein
LRQVVKRDLPIAFVPQQLTSYGGLELLRRYVRHLELPRRLNAACAAVGGDYRGSRLTLLLMALLYVGARRLEHLHYLVGDPLVRRFAGLTRVPTARTVSNWLRRFTQETLRPLIQLNQELVLDTLARLDVPPSMSTAPWSAPERRSPGRSAASIRTIAKTAATIRCWLTSPRPGTSCASRIGPGTCTTPSKLRPFCGT